MIVCISDDESLRAWIDGAIERGSDFYEFEPEAGERAFEAAKKQRDADCNSSDQLLIAAVSQAIISSFRMSSRPKDGLPEPTIN